jgi:predicted permease
VGRTILLNRTPFTVVGVAPAGFRGVSLIDAPEFWVTTPAAPVLFSGPQGIDFMRSRRAVMAWAVGRLKPGVTLAQADLALRPISQHLAAAYPADNSGRAHRLIPIAEAMIDPNMRADMVRAGRLLMALSGLILLIACANLANLLLARAGAREREIALRVALGARRGQVIRQLLQESLLLAALGGTLGIGLAHWLRDVLWALRPRGFPDTFAVPMDGGVLAFAVAVSLLTGLLFGVVPALAGSRVDLVAVLKRTVREGGVPLWSFRNFLVATQIALSVVALVVAGLFLRSLQRANTVSLGWNSREVALFSAAVMREGYDAPRALEYYERALERLRAVPGVIEATLSSRPFLTGVNPQRTIRPQGEDEAMRTRGQFMSYAAVMPGFFRFMGIDLVAGRDFAPEDDGKRGPVAIVNEALAQRAWPGQEPLGKKLKLYNDETLVEVIGVVRNVRDVELKAGPAPFVFFPMRQQFSGANAIHVRVAGSATALLPTLRKELQALDPAVTLYGMITYDEIIRHALWGQRTGAALMTVFGLIALLLTALGIYAVMAHAVGQRTREIGIRIAIGAQARAVLALVLRRGVIVAGVGLLAGLAVSLAVTRSIGGLLFEVEAHDPVTFAAIAAVLGGVALLACYLPARRATRVDPLIALRSE